MRISDSAYMSVEAMARLAAQHTDKPCSAKGLAEWINRPVSYTEALLAQLCKAGLVVSPWRAAAVTPSPGRRTGSP